MATQKENMVSNPVGQKALSSGELKMMLGQCLKMASENKITSANTWGLPLIEHLDSLIKEEDAQKSTNFQKASVTLDAGVKIYSYRVDSVHTETFKILGGLGRACGPEDMGGDPGDGGVDGENVSPSKRSRRNNELNPEATLEPTLEALNVKKFDLAFAVDPLFHKTSAQFDEGGARGLLLNNLSVYKGCDIVFDSMDVPERAIDQAAVASAALSDAHVDLSNVQQQLDAVRNNANNPSANRISPALDEILMNLMQGKSGPTDSATIAAVDEYVQSIAEAAGDVRPMKPIAVLHPVSADVAVDHHDGNTGDEWMADAGGDQQQPPAYVGYNDDDADYGGGYDGGYGDDDDVNDDVQGVAGHHGHVAGTAATGINTALDEDAIGWLMNAGTGTGGNFVTGSKGWAGASHWKYKSALSAGQEDEEVDGPAAGTKGSKKKTTGARKKNDPLDFVALMSQGEEPEFDVLPRAKGPRKAKPAAKTLLPEDHHYKADMLARYALRPRNGISVVGGGNATDQRQVSYADHDDYGNGAEADFDGGYNGMDDDDGDAYGGAPDWDAFGFGSEAGLQLVDAARKVEKVDVNYSKAAKQVDVRSLKELMWSGIQQVMAQHAKQGVPEELDIHEILRTVPYNNAAGRLEDLSVHLCFICVLHLANEHGLVVKAVPELDRLLISNVPIEA